MKPVRAFASVKVHAGREPHIDVTGIRYLASMARIDFADALNPFNREDGWKRAKRDGWRIRPVLVTLEGEHEQ